MDLGSGSTYSENMSAASGGRGGSQNQAPSGFGGNDGGNDVYSGYVKASQPRGGLNAIKDYFTGDGYDYGYQRSFGKDIRGIGGLLLNLINPALGLAYRGYQAFKPDLNLLKNSPTIESFLNNRRNLMEEVPLNKVNIFGQPEGIVGINRPDRMMFADLTGAQQKALDKQKMGLDMGLFTIDDIRQNISPLNDPKAPATIQDIKQYYGII